MGLMHLTPDDTELLSFMGRIGWFPGRQVDLGSDLESWAAHGYEVPDVVREFMTECSGLKFEYPRHPAVGGSHSCLVSGATSSRRVGRSLVAEYEEQLGWGLCPIGQSASGGLLLLMASNGTTYGGHDRFFAKIADDGYHALLAIWKRDALT